jgi:hypothetical protein
MSIDDGLTELWLKRVYGDERAPERLRTTLPSADLERARDGRGRRTLNLLAGIAGVAVVSAAIGWTGLQLAHHHNSSSTPGTATLTSLPHYGPGGLPSPVQILVPLRHGTGAALLLPFTAAEPYYVQFVCSGGGTFAFESLDSTVEHTVDHCDGLVITVREPSLSAPVSSVLMTIKPTILRLSAQPSTSWEIIVVQEGSNVLPPLGTGGDLPVPAQILVPLTQGSGSLTLPTFTPTRPYYIDYVCDGTFGPIDIDSSDGAVHYASEGCGSAVGGEILDPAADQVLGKPVTLRVVAPEKRWEILVVQSEAPVDSAIPVGFSLPAGATVLVPWRYGTGATTLPSFAPTRRWFIEVTCSGDGSLSVVSASGSTLNRVSCGVGTRYGAIDGSAQTIQLGAQRQTLSVEADAASSWLILVYEDSA